MSEFCVAVLANSRASRCDFGNRSLHCSRLCHLTSRDGGNAKGLPGAILADLHGWPLSKINQRFLKSGLRMLDMQPLTRDDLFSLEKYAEAREEFRARVLEHKKRRKVAVGPNATLYFEDRLTIQYQVQEMLRVERIFEKTGIEDELSAYNPLIPDGSNLKATFMLEYDDIDERRQQLGRLIGIGDTIWIQVGNGERAFAIADEDLDREDEEKTSSVHFLRFELSADDVRAAKSGAAIAVGIAHDNYTHQANPLPGVVRDALSADLD